MLNAARFVDRDMLLRYHWGHGVGHVYSHVTRAEATSSGNAVSTPANTHMPISDPADVELDVDISDDAEALEDWEDCDSDSNDTESDDRLDEAFKSDVGSGEEDLIDLSPDSESIHPGIDTLEYDDYRY